MAHLLTDWRKTALGAGGLVVFVLMLTYEGGAADTAVDKAEVLADSNRHAIDAGAQTHKAAWFARDESSYEVHPAPPPPPSTELAEAPPAPSLASIHPPPPEGADFPAGRGRGS